MDERAEREPFLRVTEIFHSIQGESTWAGLPCTFVRLTGCPLRCVWCDTAYAFQGGTRMTLGEIVERGGGRRHGARGGDRRRAARPPERVPAGEARSSTRGHRVLVETSGAFDVAPLDPRAHKIMDLKCPGSGESARNLWANLDHLTARDEVKFVVKDRDDWEWVRETIRERGLDRRVEEASLRALLVSPVWGEIDLEALAGWILEEGLPVRLQLQLHKLVWGAERTGV